MSKKIGILTTYYSKNYGAALQAYAISKKLEMMGYDQELIQYKKEPPSFYTPMAILEAEKNRTISQKVMQKINNTIIKIKKLHRNDKGIALRNKMFDEFVSDFLGLSHERYASEEEFIKAVPNMTYDVFLCGSDQIWNPIVHNFDQVYYLNFKTRAKKVAYAPSVAFNQFTDREIRRICDSIQSIDYISVREKSTIVWLQPNLEKKVHLVIDPTFLLDKQEWLTLPTEKHPHGNYILVYLLNYNEQNSNIVELISRYAIEKQYNILCLPYTNIKFPKKIPTEYRYDIAPNDFIHLLNGAKCIITNSFHATALSINLNKPFFVVSSKNRNQGLQTRLSDLLEETKLENRKIFPDTDHIEDSHIDYCAVNAVISAYRKNGEDYLHRALRDC